jgi:hypothetical protein
MIFSRVLFINLFVDDWIVNHIHFFGDDMFVLLILDAWFKINAEIRRKML